MATIKITSLSSDIYGQKDTAGSNDFYLWEKFQAPANFSLKYFKLNIWKSFDEGSTGNIRVELRSVSSGLPTSTVLDYVDVDIANLPTESGQYQTPQVHSQYLCTTGTWYAIVVRNLDGSPSPTIYWDHTSYNYGYAGYTDDAGANWYTNPNDDLLCEVWGEPILFNSVFSRLKPPKGRMLNKGHFLARNLVGCWLQNEGGGRTVNDYSSCGHLGTFVNNPVWDIGVFGSVIRGQSRTYPADHINCVGTNTHYSKISKYTLLLWFKAQETYGFYTGISAGWWPSFALRWHIYDIYTTRLGSLLTNSDGTDLSVYEDWWALDNKWHQAVAVYDGAKNYLYRDGKLKNSGSASGAIKVPTYDFTINALYNSPYNGMYENRGIIDHCMVWDRPLSTSEVAYLYREPFCMFEEDMG